MELTSLAAPLIAASVAFISFRQWLIAREKMRLDLFNRRFDIYQRFLDLHEYLAFRRHPDASGVELWNRLERAAAEASFLFPAESKVAQSLNDFHEITFALVRPEVFLPEGLNGKPIYNAAAREFSEHVRLIAFTQRARLDVRIDPYLRFYSAGDPLTWLSGRRARKTARRGLVVKAKLGEKRAREIRAEARLRKDENPFSSSLAFHQADDEEFAP